MSRVLIISQFFPPESFGGAHRWQKLVEELPDTHDCRVLTAPPAYPHGEFEHDWRPYVRNEVDGVGVTQLWSYQPTDDSTAEGSNLGRILNYSLFALFASLYVLVNFWRYDTVITVSSPHTTFLPGFVGSLLGLSWVPDVYDLWLDNAVDYGYIEEGAVPYKLIAFLERQAIVNSASVFAVTETMADDLAENYGVSRGRFTVLPFGVDLELFGSDDRPSDRNDGPEPAEGAERTVVYVGNLGDAHALRPFVKAFELLDNAQLLIYGTGKRRDEIEELCTEVGLTDSVSFEGVVPRERIASVLRDVDASIVPLKSGKNLDYARPNKILESMAAGTPFVGSDLREIRRVAETTAAGTVVENDPRAVAEGILEVTEDPETGRQMGRRGMEFVSREHSWRRLADRVNAVLSTPDSPHERNSIKKKSGE